MCNQNIKTRDVIASGTDTGTVCRMMLEHWNVLETLTLARATYTYVWARNAEGGRGAEQKLSVEAITN